MALLGLPKPARAQPILVRADSAGATHAFIDDLVGRNLAFSVGFDCDSRVQQAILALPEAAFTPALNPDGRPRRGAWVAELASLDLQRAGWPEGIRASCRRERPHPGAAHKMAFTDAAGHRFQVFVTNQPVSGAQIRSWHVSCGSRSVAARYPDASVEPSVEAILSALQTRLPRAASRDQPTGTAGPR
jgi:hypothetical protein